MQGSRSRHPGYLTLYLPAFGSHGAGAAGILREFQQIHRQHEEAAEIRSLEQENAKLLRQLDKAEHEREFLELQNVVLQEMARSGTIPPNGS